MEPATHRPQARWGELRDWLSDDPIDPMADTDDRALRNASVLALTLTLVIVVTGAPPATPTLAPVVAVAGLAVPGLARNRWYWVLVAGLFAMSPIERPWLALDNHHWLQLYWVVAIALSRFATAKDEVLRTSARLLVGFAFLFAVLWKLIAPEFVSGGFFDATIAADSRLADVAALAGVKEPDAAAANRAIITDWRRPGTVPEPGALLLSDAVMRITPWLAWATIVVEGAVAVAFLAPLVKRLRWLRDASMIVFVFATYPLAPVVGFGQLLLVMTAMQSELRPRVRAIVYVGGFLLVGLLSERSIALDWLDGLLNPGET